MFRFIARFLFIVIASAPAFFAAQAAPVKVGVFKQTPYLDRFPLAANVLEALSDSEAFAPSFFSALTPDAIAPFDVLVFPCVKNVGEQTGDWRTVIRDSVADGKGVVLSHDSCGLAHALSPALFPEVATCVERAAAYPIDLTAPGQRALPTAPKSFAPSLSDYVTMTPGPKGTVWAADRKKAAVIVAGEWDKGKVLAIGALLAFDPKNADETKLLRAGVKWAATRGVKAAKMGAVDPQRVRKLEYEIAQLKQEIQDLKAKLTEQSAVLYNLIQMERKKAPAP